MPDVGSQEHMDKSKSSDRVMLPFRSLSSGFASSHLNLVGHQLFQNSHENVIQMAPPWSDLQPNSLVPKFQHLQLLAIFEELSILFLYLFPWTPSPHATPPELPWSRHQSLRLINSPSGWSHLALKHELNELIHLPLAPLLDLPLEKRHGCQSDLDDFKGLGKNIGPSQVLIISNVRLQFTVHIFPIFPPAGNPSASHSSKHCRRQFEMPWILEDVSLVTHRATLPR